MLKKLGWLNSYSRFPRLAFLAKWTKITDTHSKP